MTESRADGLPVGAASPPRTGTRSGYVADPATEHVVPLPDELDPVLGVYVAHMGRSARTACCTRPRTRRRPVRVARPTAVAGRRVLVVGAGVVGLLTGLLARHHGAAEVVVGATPPRAGSRRRRRSG